MKEVTHCTSQPGMICNQDTTSGHAHLHPDMPQRPAGPWFLSVCQTRQASLLEHSGITSIEVLTMEKKVMFILIEKRPKQKELTG